MEKTHRKELLIGIISVVAILVLIFGINLLKGKVILSKQTTYYAVFPNVEGLMKSGNVYMNGMHVGTISDIHYLDPTVSHFLIAMSIKKDIKIPLDSKAVIFSSGILEGNGIKIVPGQNVSFLSAEDTLQTEIEQSTLTNLAPMVEKANVILLKLDTTLHMLNSVLNQKTRQDIIQSFESLRVSMENTERITNQVIKMIDKDKENIHRVIANAENITQNLRANNELLSNAIQNFSNISDTLAQAQLKGTIEQTNQALSSLNTILGKVNEGQGSLGLLVNDKKLYENLSSTADELKALIEAIKNNPKKYLNVSVF